MNCFHFGNSWGNNMIVKELKRVVYYKIFKPSVVNNEIK